MLACRQLNPVPSSPWRPSTLVIPGEITLAQAAPPASGLFRSQTDGVRVVTASLDKTARLWDGKSGQLVATLTGHGDRVWSAAFSPDGARVVTASYDGEGRVWIASREGWLIEACNLRAAAGCTGAWPRSHPALPRAGSRACGSSLVQFPEQAGSDLTPLRATHRALVGSVAAPAKLGAPGLGPAGIDRPLDTVDKFRGEAEPVCRV